METHVVGHLNVSQSNLAASVLVKHRVRLVHQALSACVQVTLHCAEQFVEGKLAVLIGVEVLHNLSHFEFAEVESVVAHGVLELNGGQRAVSVAVHGLEHDAQAAETVGTPLFDQLNHLFFYLSKV